MPSSFPDRLKAQSEEALTHPHYDFIAKYHAVADLRRLARKHTGVLDEKTLAALEDLLRTRAFRKIRQSYFLFREAASVMTDLATSPESGQLGGMALASLNRLLRVTHESAHRGVAEALGSLPVDIASPRMPAGKEPHPPAVDWVRLTKSNGLTLTAAPRYIGRSLVAPTASRDRLLVVKLAKSGDTPGELAGEIRWMEHLREPGFAFDRRFHIPAPLLFDGHRLFRLDRLPSSPPAAVNRHPDKIAVAFLAHRDYFVYPNHHGVDGESAAEMLARNAYLLGRLTAKGVIHNAPIPLFHNRTQRLRRDDQGRYQWFRAGRLDQWLDSCRFPNFGLSGLRDFEHLEPLSGGSQTLYRHIGSHLLSLLLVAGSVFRCREATRVGWDEKGNPLDTRDLFDRQLLGSMIREIFRNYYSGFTGSQASIPLPLDADRLVERMIDEMGVDRHMTELLRRADQNALSDSQFFGFLRERGYGAEQLEGMLRGEKDILIKSGPHLGDFNRQISLPELIEAVAAMSAVCMAGRYARQNKAGSS
ncbi:SidJ-related pseudokinase [uncultured Desulfosarcina sp.]|uniref:SidJ-related pseudokinase n=1 Tax=uncultured Desulfosarcina sp. TaxID=218289 RepID=UPI0029C88E7C|nr:SidJ-related pseudokinase [uncultured Desulfosarcina sp.]